MTPHHLHAVAAAWSLQAALAALQAAAMEAVADALAGDTGRRDISIPSQQFGRRHALGGHGDPTADHALGAWAPTRPDPCAEALGSILRELDRLAGHLPGAPGQDPATRIRQAIPGMRPHVAARTSQALRHLDRAARRHLHMPPDLAPLPGNPPCPACRLQMLQVHTADPTRTVVCTADCHCTGDTCPCGMPVRLEGAAHIWTSDRLTREAA
ncbi:hypothetical protein ACGFIG_09385 [Micromonospora sp. NPDC049048]|uniref:hypothetical protein n=1 Tax=Micromonospora sp. NPDC049048 TaxID=3364263 RepID=UPI00371ECF48